MTAQEDHDHARPAQGHDEHGHDDHAHDERGHDDHGHDDHDHAHDGHGHDHHGHDHPGGVVGLVKSVFAPHSHDAADQVDRALEASDEGPRALKISLVALG